MVVSKSHIEAFCLHSFLRQPGQPIITIPGPPPRLEKPRKGYLTAKNITDTEKWQSYPDYVFSFKLKRPMRREVITWQSIKILVISLPSWTFDKVYKAVIGIIGYENSYCSVEQKRTQPYS